MNARDYFFDLHVLTLLCAPIKKLNHPICDLFADGDAIGNADQISVLELHAGAFVAVIKQNFQAGSRQIPIQLFAGFSERLVFNVRHRYEDIEWGDRLWPDDAVMVMVLLDGRRDDTFNADAVAAHDNWDFLAVLRQYRLAHRLGILRSQLEEVTDLHRLVNVQHTRIASR